MNRFQDLFDAQKALFATGVTRSYEWRVDQLDRMAAMIGENEHRFQEAIARDFKTASYEYNQETAGAIKEAAFQKSNLKEWMEPVEAPVPRFLRASGYKAFVHRDPYGVALIMGPFNGPLLLLIRPALAALAAGNTCILKVHQELTTTSPLLAELVQQYFDPAAVTTSPGDIPSTTEILGQAKVIAGGHSDRDERYRGHRTSPAAPAWPASRTAWALGGRIFLDSPRGAGPACAWNSRLPPPTAVSLP